MEIFLKSLARTPPVRIRGVGIYLTGSPEGVPLALIHNLKNNQVLHEHVVLLTLLTEEVPRVEESQRIVQTELGQGFHRAIARYGFMETRHVPSLIERISVGGKPVLLQPKAYFLSRETLIPTRRRGMWIWREKLFAALSRNALPATAFFGLPPNQVVEIGTQIEL